MIVFTIDSTSPICILLKNDAIIQSTALFFDDGLKQHKVVAFKPVEQCFNVNGMYQTHTVGYTIDLINGTALKLDINGELLNILSFEKKLNLNNQY